MNDRVFILRLERDNKGNDDVGNRWEGEGRVGRTRGGGWWFTTNSRGYAFYLNNERGN